MTQTGWIIVGIIALAAIILLVVLLRRKPVATTVVEATPAPAPTPPQTIAAEDTPPPAPKPFVPQPPVPQPSVEPAAPAEPVPVEPVIQAAPEPAITPEPAPLSAAPVTVDAGSDGDNLLKLKGVGPKIATLLKAEGITRYAQIAGWSDADIAAIDGKLGSFAGRPTRDNWIDQARLLAAGDTAGYEAKYGKLS